MGYGAVRNAQYPSQLRMPIASGAIFHVVDAEGEGMDEHGERRDQHLRSVLLMMDDRLHSGMTTGSVGRAGAADAGSHRGNPWISGAFGNASRFVAAGGAGAAVTGTSLFEGESSVLGGGDDSSSVFRGVMGSGSAVVMWSQQPSSSGTDPDAADADAAAAASGDDAAARILDAWEAFFMRRGAVSEMGRGVHEDGGGNVDDPVAGREGVAGISTTMAGGELLPPMLLQQGGDGCPACTFCDDAGDGEGIALSNAPNDDDDDDDDDDGDGGRVSPMPAAEEEESVGEMSEDEQCAIQGEAITQVPAGRASGQPPMPITLIVYVYWMPEGLDSDEEKEEGGQQQQQHRDNNNSRQEDRGGVQIGGSADAASWQIRTVEYKLTQTSSSGSYEMEDFQVNHLSRCMLSVNAKCLRFTVYTRDDNGDIVELLNTGMLRVDEFMPQNRQPQQQQHDSEGGPCPCTLVRGPIGGDSDSFTEGAEGPHSEFVLDFAEDVSGLGCSVCRSCWWWWWWWWWCAAYVPA
jgi:hypothetical protein